MTTNLTQHEEFLPAMEAFEGYMKLVQGGKGPYSSTKTREGLVAFAGVLVGHLHEEVRTYLSAFIPIFGVLIRLDRNNLTPSPPRIRLAR